MLISKLDCIKILFVEIIPQLLIIWYTKYLSLKMKPIPRRKFIQGTALAGGALLLNPALNAFKFLDTQSSDNYFLKEFGIDETICRKLLAL